MKLTGLVIACLMTVSPFAAGQDESVSDVQSRIVALEEAWNQA